MARFGAGGDVNLPLGARDPGPGGAVPGSAAPWGRPRGMGCGRRSEAEPWGPGAAAQCRSGAAAGGGHPARGNPGAGGGTGTGDRSEQRDRGSTGKGVRVTGPCQRVGECRYRRCSGGITAVLGSGDGKRGSLLPGCDETQSERCDRIRRRGSRYREWGTGLVPVPCDRVRKKRVPVPVLGEGNRPGIRAQG